jgi:sugar-specific transcriptional regulator TrmB
MSDLSVSNENVQALTQLGLSSLEARIFTALTQTERATIKTLSKSTGLARQHVYQVINDLLDIGIIEKIVAAPFEYSAIPIKDAIFIMLQRKQQEFLDMEAKIESTAKQMLERYEAASKMKNTSLQEEQTFVFRSVSVHKNAQVRIREFSNCKTSIDLIVLERNLESINEELGNALKKQVKIRMIIGNTERSSFHLNLKDLMANPFLEARVSLNEAIFPFAILDEKQAVVITSKLSDFPKASYLETNNSHLMAIAKVYFEKQWTDSQTLKPTGNYGF